VRTKGVLQMRTSVPFVKKDFGFFEFMMGGGVNHCGHFADKEVNFSRFYADVLNGRPLIKQLSP